MLQRHHGVAYTKLHFILDGLEELLGDDKYGLYITEYPADLNSLDPCASVIVGDVYNPESINISLPDYSTCCQEDHKDCAIGDLATRHSPLSGNDSGVFVELQDCNLDLYGPNSVIGHAMILKKLGTDKTLSCCNIQMPTSTRILRAQFDNALRGEIEIIHPQYDSTDHIINENTIIMVDLELIKRRSTDMLYGWHLQYGTADKTCSHLYPVLDQQSMIPGNSNLTCSRTYHRTCYLGDLTTKCGPLQFKNNWIRTQCTDNQLGLVPYSTLDRLAVSIGSYWIEDCANLNEQMPTGAYVNFWLVGVFVILVFSQLSQYDPTLYRSHVVGLNGQAGDIVVYDGSDPNIDFNTCSHLGNVLDHPGRSLVANPSTCDQYSVGELGQKMGGVRGKTNLHTQGLSSNIPLTGPVNILDKPITVLFKNGSV